MQSESIKFYSNRLITGLLGVLMIGVIYIFYTKILTDTYLLTGIAVAVFWALTIIAFILGIACFIKTFDPRPVVEITSEGMKIRTFVFFEAFVPWHEISGINQERFTNVVATPVTFAFTRSNFLRVYRHGKRSVAINLLLLNKRGNEFSDTLARHLAS
ncbi:hypothetical protein [Fictibacillus gelatini]|uniref:hypothetical protein n=1 Tax=Fictibacillus gelatini TaxID=225985 RepID=UPI00040AE62E|nr:hypothetical protein [Fictibacillus gelatini]